MPDLLSAVHAKHPDWRAVRIRENSPDVYLLAPDYPLDDNFPPTRHTVHLPRWRGLVHIQRAPQAVPVNDAPDRYFLHFGEVEMFGDPEMLTEIAPSH
jgi:hypothetical protein